ncbi:Glucan endo-1,3-alpha-glucosidase agn1 [Didymella sp. IMI 355093]|nr:Glucan endo-1,3-alpha-glucosidase agn1 [Didymella sp. IMI 355093]
MNQVTCALSTLEERVALVPGLSSEEVGPVHALKSKPKPKPAKPKPAKPKPAKPKTTKTTKKPAVPSTVAPSKKPAPPTKAPVSQPPVSKSKAVSSKPKSSTLSTATVSNGEACELVPGKPGKIGARAPIRNCKPDPKHTSTITSSTSVIKTHTEVCKAAVASQACYHYYSAIQNNKHKKWDVFTCSDAQKRHDGYATQLWENEHPKNQWRDYLPSAMTRADGVVKCQRDEYPPGYWMPADTLANKGNRHPQIIRWLPEGDNGKGGEIWTRFCSKNDGGKGNGQMKAKNKMEIPNLDLQKLQSKREKVNGQTTTTYYDATYTRAVFTMSFDWGGKAAPGPSNDWHLYDNPCWPKAIAFDDPGYVLNTDDNWYATAGSPQQKADRKIQKALYKGAPPANYLQKAIKPKRRRAGNSYVPRDVGVLDDDILLDVNGTTPAIDEPSYEIIDCTSSDCQEERKWLRDEEIVAVIPADDARQELPSANVDAVPTGAVGEKVLLPSKRSEVSPELATATAGF